MIGAFGRQSSMRYPEEWVEGEGRWGLKADVGSRRDEG